MTSTWGNWDDDLYDYEHEDDDSYDPSLSQSATLETALLEIELAFLSSWVRAWDAARIVRAREGIADRLARTQALEDELAREVRGGTVAASVDLPPWIRVAVDVPRRGVRKKLRALTAISETYADRFDALKKSVERKRVSTPGRFAIDAPAVGLADLRYARAAVEAADRDLGDWLDQIVAPNRKLVLRQYEDLNDRPRSARYTIDG